MPWENTQRTTTLMPVFYEDPNLYTNRDYTTRSTRPTMRPTRTSTIRSTSRPTTRSSTRTTSNYWPGTTERQQQNQQHQQNQYNNQQQNQNQYNEQNQYNQQDHYNQQNQYNQPNQNNQNNQQNCHPSITTVNKKRVNCKGNLIFEEQFNQGLLDRWSQDIRMPLEFEVIPNFNNFLDNSI